MSFMLKNVLCDSFVRTLSTQGSFEYLSGRLIYKSPSSHILTNYSQVSESHSSSEDGYTFKTSLVGRVLLSPEALVYELILALYTYQ